VDLKEADILGGGAGSHWYYRSKLAAVRVLTSRLRYLTILDIGAGSGFFSRALLVTGPATRAICLDPSYTVDRDESVNGKLLRFRREGTASDADLLLFMDVLEHVDDDLGLLRQYTDAAPVGSHVLISVPAFMFLWSGHDVFLGHRRRYTLAQLTKLVERAQLRVVHSCYFFGFVFPIVVATRLLEQSRRGSGGGPKSQLRSHHPVVNRVLTGVCRAEMPLFKLNRVAGLTAFCLARKEH
jgi:SAM-dependent methyltransferase